MSTTTPEANRMLIRRLERRLANFISVGGSPPAGHHLTHQSGGSDSIKLDDLATPDDNTDLNASTAKHGLMPKWTSTLISALLDLITTTQGAILYRGASAWAGLTRTTSVNIPIGDGTAVIATGVVKLDVDVPVTCTLTKWRLLADVSGSLVVDIWKDTYANYPPTVADTIIGGSGNKPTLSSAIKNEDATLTGYTTSFSAGDTLRFNVDSATTVTYASLILTFSF